MVSDADAEEEIWWISIMLANETLPLVNVLATLFIFTVVQKMQLLPSIAFTSITLFHSLAGDLMMVGWIAQMTIHVTLCQK
jgi:hypothetical protein